MNIAASRNKQITSTAYPQGINNKGDHSRVGVASMGGLRFALLCAIFHLESVDCVKIGTDPTKINQLQPESPSNHENSVDICTTSASSCNGIFCRFIYCFVRFFSFLSVTVI